jgi:Mg-chelatase subunit ChlD/Tol biopolymer transport system component
MIKKQVIGILLMLILACVPFQRIFAHEDEQPANALVLDGSVSPQSVQAGEIVEINLAILGNLDACDPSETRVPLDIVLVIDRSGSMDQSLGTGFSGSKLDGALQAVETFASNADPLQDRVALVAFSDDSFVYAPLGDQLSLLAQFYAIRAGREIGAGATNIESGLSAAAGLLENHRPDALPVTILLTDGMQTDGNAEKESRNLKKDGVHLVTIGLGPEVEHRFLMDLASESADYYSAPDTASLRGIFESIALNIQTYSPASDITVRFVFDVLNFDLIEESLSPEPDEVSVDVITWRFDEMDAIEKNLSLSLAARVPGVYDSALSAQISYVSCGEGLEKSELNTLLPVTVEGGGISDPVCAVTDSQQVSFLGFFCGFKFWGLLGGLLIGLALLLLWYLNHLKAFQSWRCCGIPLSPCIWAKIPLILWTAVFLGALLSTFANQACSTKQGLLFWRILPDRSSAVFVKPVKPSLPAKPLTQIFSEQEWMGFYSASEQAQTLAAVSRGTNGLITGFNFQGHQIDFPQIQGSHPAWSPDGTKLAYSANNEDIYILDTQTGANQPLMGASDPNIIETMPAWNAEGSVIAFVRASSGAIVDDVITLPTDIMFVPVSGGNPLLLPGASGEGFNYYPAFSPDGKWIAFTHHTSGKNASWVPEAEIRIIPAEGGAPRKIQANFGPGGQALPEAGNIWPTWSKDSMTLYFSSRRCDDQYDIYATSIDEEGNSGPAERRGDLSLLDSYEYKVTEVDFQTIPLIRRLLSLWPFLIPLPLLLLLLWISCRTKPPQKREDTLGVTVSVEPKTGNNQPNQKFNVSLELLPKPICEKKIVNKNTDAVILIDASASMEERDMGGQSRLIAAKEAAKKFVECVLSEEKRIAIVSFSDQAKVHIGLTNDQKQLLQAVDEIEMGGSTNMTQGLAESRNLLENSSRRDVVKSVILLSDGAPNNPEGVLAEAEILRTQQVKVLAIGVGRAIEELLRIISNPDGHYKFVSDRHGLMEAFLEYGRVLISPVPAQDIVVRHMIDSEKFKLLPESIFPLPVDFSDSVIAWSFKTISNHPKYCSYSVRPLSDGDLFIDKTTEIKYIRCEGTEPRTMQVPSGAKVSVADLGITPIAKPYQFPEPYESQRPDIVWQPDRALFIGVGHYGRKILTYIRKNLLDAGVGNLPEGCEFLVFDTGGYDQLEGLGNPLAFAGVEIPDRDVFMLDENLHERILNWANNPSELPCYLEKWFNPRAWVGRGPELNLASGRYTHRALTRVALLRHIMEEDNIASQWMSGLLNEGHDTNIHSWIKSRCESAKKNNGDLRVFFVGAMGDGMSGTILDIALLTKQIALEVVDQANDVKIEAYFLDAPSITATIQDHRIKDLYSANAFATLREINRWQLNLTEGLSLVWMENPQTSPPFDELYLYPKGTHDDLYIEAFPVIADFVTGRLDRAAGFGSQGDWFISLHQVRSQRKRMLHKNVIGSVSAHSLRIPIADILKSINARWAYSLIKKYFAGLENDEIIFDPNLAQDPGLTMIPESLVMYFLKGWCDFGGKPSAESIKLSELLSDSDSLSDGKVERQISDTLPTKDNQQIRLDFQKRLIEAISHILNGTKEYRLGSRAGKLAYLIAFLESFDEKLSRVTRHPDVSQQLTGVITIYREVIKTYLEDAIQMKTLLVETRPDQALGLIQQLQHNSSSLENVRQDLDRITSRAYFWDDGNDNEYSKIWYAEFLQGTEDEYLPLLRWAVDEKGIDFALWIKDADIGLKEDGKIAFIQSLLDFALRFSKDAWNNVKLMDIMEAKGLRHNEEFGRSIRSQVDLASSRIFNGMDTGFNVGKILMMAPPTVQEGISNSEFLRGLNALPANVGISCGNIQPLDSTDRYAIIWLRIMDAINTENLSWFEECKKKYFALNEQNEFTSVLPQELCAAEIEADEEYYGKHEQFYLSSLLINGFENRELVELFCLALAEGFIQKNTRGELILDLGDPNLPSKTILAKGDLRIDMVVEGLLAWVVAPDDYIREIDWLKKHYLDPSNVANNLFLEWVDGGLSVNRSWVTQAPENVSLRYLVITLVSNYLRTRSTKWNNR